ncbi:MAG: hypothetical protein ACKVXR_13830 [Planctomycetota bacterium]
MSPARTWLPRLIELSDRLRVATRGALIEAIDAGKLDAMARPVGQGAGDATYGLDVPAERELDRWLEENARRGPLSLLTEDAGWRHRGPGMRGRTVELPGFDHGGPRISVDPVDGTRVLMTDLRSAWSVIGLAGPGEEAPRLSEVEVGVLSEIPDSRAASYRRLAASRGAGCTLEERTLRNRTLRAPLEISTGKDGRPDHGFFPFFRYATDQRPALAAIEAAFFARLASHEGAEVRNCYDDQYTSNGGQLALLALGRYRMIADLRAWEAERRKRASVTSKPYDVAGAVLCAREAGCVVEAADGGALDFPLDAETPVSFVGWVNATTRKRLRKHLSAAMRR